MAASLLHHRPTSSWTKPPLRHLLEHTSAFVTVAELVTSRGGLKAYREEKQILEGPPVYRDGSLRATSAWANTFQNRDHRKKSSAS
jgi:hypothetical protein